MSEIEVKALEWTRVPKEAWDDPETRRATTPVHRQYYITFEQGDWWYANKPYKTEDEAKAAAQSDFDARIRSAIERKAEPVAWRCKDYADGWILYDSELRARDYKVKTGCLMQPLYSTPPAAAVTGEDVRAAFEKWTKPMALDLTMSEDAWGRPIYKHSHIEAMWDGFKAGAALSRPGQGGTQNV